MVVKIIVMIIIILIIMVIDLFDWNHFCGVLDFGKIICSILPENESSKKIFGQVR